MGRYFYTDPLAAAWMEKHFGMRLQLDAECQFWTEDGKAYFGSRHFWVHPDSVPLLQPQIDDIVLNCDDDPARVVPTGQLEYGPSEAPLRHAIEFVASGAATIIQRYGRAFHWPEREP